MNISTRSGRNVVSFVPENVSIFTSCPSERKEMARRDDAIAAPPDSDDVESITIFICVEAEYVRIGPLRQCR